MSDWLKNFILAVVTMAAVVMIAWIGELTIGIPRNNFVLCALMVFVLMGLFKRSE